MLNSGDGAEKDEDGIEVSGRFFGLLVLGIILVSVGVIVLVIASFVLSGSGSGSFGGVVLIGPVPIIFGSGSNSIWLILIGVIVTVFSVVLFVVMNRKSERIVGF